MAPSGPMKLDGTRTLVTGASSGIGAELAVQLGEVGARVCLAARRRELLDEVAERVRRANPSAVAHALPVDLDTEAACRGLVDRSVEALGGLDLLVINAGISMNALFEELPDPLATARAIMETNYFAAVALTAQALPHLRRSRGRIVVVSSLIGVAPLPTRTAYAASKHAVHGFFDSLRAEVGAEVGITLACPGAVATPIREVSRAQGRGATASELPDDEQMSAAECARLILDAARAEKRELLMTLPGKLSPWMRLIAPGVIDRVTRYKLGLHRRR